MAEQSRITAEPGTSTIEIVRDFDAPPAAVFDAWTQPEHVAQWWDPSGIPLAECTIDLRAGGAYRWVPAGPDGHAYPFTGTYREIAPPRRLVFTVDGPTPDMNSVAELEFSGAGGRTTLTITMRSTSVAARDAMLAAGVDKGTTRTLDNLARHLGDTNHPGV